VTDSRLRILQRRYELTGDEQDLDLLLQEYYRTGTVVNFQTETGYEEIQRVLNRPIAESLQITFANISPREDIAYAIYTYAEMTARLEAVGESSETDFKIRALGILLDDLSEQSSVWACVWQSQDSGVLHCRGMLIHRYRQWPGSTLKYPVIALTTLLEGSYNVDAALTIHRLTERATQELTELVNRISNRPVKSQWRDQRMGTPIVSQEILWLPPWFY